MHLDPQTPPDPKTEISHIPYGAFIELPIEPERSAIGVCAYWSFLLVLKPSGTFCRIHKKNTQLSGRTNTPQGLYRRFLGAL